MNNNKTPLIFNKKTNNTSKSLSLSQNNNKQIGVVKHYLPSNKEWLNSVYTYNKNYMKNLPIYHSLLNKLIESHFNFFIKNKSKRMRSRLYIRLKRLSVKNIFFSKPEIRYTNDKINVTMYVYNEERRFLIFKLLKVLKTLNSPISSKDFNNFLLKRNDSKKISNFNKVSSEYLENYLMSKPVLGKEYEDILNKSLILEEKLNSIKDIFKEYNKIDSNILKSTLKEDMVNKIELLGKQATGFCYLRESKLGELGMKKILGKLWKSKEYYENLIHLNNSKFKFDEKGLLLKLSLLISKIYNKKVEFNFINIKNIHLNSDILTKVIALKLKNRRSSVSRVLKYSLRLVKLPNINSINLKYGFGNLNSTKLKNNVIIKNPLKEDILNKKLLINFNNKTNSIHNNSLEKLVLNSLKYKAITGIRLEAKGRLTKRLTASRSVFKVKWKGALRNLYSSYRGLSSVMLRGNFKSNVQYSILNSKGRNGAFGVKGWISSN